MTENLLWLELVKLTLELMELLTKLSVMSPNTIHMRGSTTPLAMAIIVPARIIAMSKLSANLNYIHIKKQWNDSDERQQKSEPKAPVTFLSVEIQIYEIRAVKKKTFNSKQLLYLHSRRQVEFTQTTRGCAALPPSLHTSPLISYTHWPAACEITPVKVLQHDYQHHNVFTC